MWSENSVPDVLVVGGGPAGSTLARLLARRGWRVVLADRARFPRPKPCGECVNPGAVAVLDRMGLLDDVEALRPARLHGWRIRGASEGAAGDAIGTFAPSDPRGLGVPREEFDHCLLVGARTAGVDVHEEVKVEQVRPGRPDRTPSVRIGANGARTGQPPSWRKARVVVGADGLRSVTARSLGTLRRDPRLRKLSLTVRLRGAGPSRSRGLLVLGDDRVVGLAPVHSDEPLWNASVVVRSSEWAPEVAERGSIDFVRSVLRADLPGWTDPPEIVGGPWASGPFDWPARRASAPGVVLVGDAAGYYDPLTGQGIFRALRSAELAAEAIDAGLRASHVPRDFTEYERSLKREFRGSRWIQKLVEGVVSRRSLREPVVRRLARSPDATRALIRVTGDAARPRTLLDPRGWAKLLAGAEDTTTQTRRGDSC